MRKSMIFGTVSVLALAGTAEAEVPAVVADIPPVHSLVAMVMGDLGTPDLLVQPGASPHGYSLRPSEARALDRARAVFWIGESLTPWLESAVGALAGDARLVELMDVEGTTRLGFRDGATFEAHDHDHAGHGHDDGQGHAGHDAHDHEEGHDEDLDEDQAQKDDHDGHDHADHGQDHHGHDPHAWLDPQNATLWLDAIATELSGLDPENAAVYRANAEAGKQSLNALTTEITARLDPVRGGNFVVFHDAYQYFETRFDIPAAGSITLSDASDPSPARIEEIHAKVQDLGIACAFTEPQFNPDLVRTVFQGTEATTGVMDPLGADLSPGAELYPQLIRNLAESLVSCLE